MHLKFPLRFAIVGVQLRAAVGGGGLQRQTHVLAMDDSGEKKKMKVHSLSVMQIIMQRFF
jgi:hypothetical protein